MPGPIAHAAAGYLIYRVFRPAMPGTARARVGPVPVLLAGSLFLSLAPDLDAVPGVLLGDLARFHNSLTHNVFAGVMLALAAGVTARALGRPEAVRWGVLALVCYQTHLAMDLVTYGSRGLMLLWPLSEERFQGPVTLFYGLRWSQGLVSPYHLITLASETGLALAAVLLVKLADRVKRSEYTQSPPPQSRT